LVIDVASNWTPRMQSGVPPILSRLAPSRNAGFDTILNAKLDFLWQKSGVLDVGAGLRHWKTRTAISSSGRKFRRFGRRERSCETEEWPNNPAWRTARRR
jgi:hypothetical protein